MKITLLFIALFISSFYSNITAQFPNVDPNWTYIRKDNTGVSGWQHGPVRGDNFGNIWMSGRESFWDQGALVRLDQDRVFTNWGTYAENYLPDASVRKIAFDNTGRIWVGTDGGLATSPDGLNWEHFTTSNSPLEGGRISGLATEADNDVWVVGGRIGYNLDYIGYYNGTSWEIYNPSNSNIPPFIHLRDIAIDSNNNKWVTTQGAGLLKFDGVSWTQYTTANSGLSGNGPQTVSVDDQDRIWILNGGDNIDIFDGTNWTHINSSNTNWPFTTFFNATSMYIRDDKVLLSETTNSSRVMWYDGVSWQGEITDYFLVDCYIDANYNNWFSGNDVVAKNDGTTWTYYTHFNTGLGDNFNLDIFIDSNNNKWFANGEGGIQVFDCPKWEAYGPLNGGVFPNPQTLSQTSIGTSITEDADGDIWFTYKGTDGYAIQIPNGDYHNYASWVTWDNTNSHVDFQVPEEVEGTDDGKIFFRNNSRNIFIYDKLSNSWSIHVAIVAPYSMTPRAGGKMYFGSFQGIDIYDNGSWSTMYLSAQGIQYVFDIAFDSNDNMWLATTEGLWKYDGTTWTNWNESNSNIASDKVYSIEIDTVNNVIYVGAYNTLIAPYYGGLSYFNGTGNMFTTLLYGSSPISHYIVDDLELDTLGNLWILTNSEGVNVYNPNGVLGFECIDKEIGNILGVQDFSDNSNLNKVICYPNPVTSIANIEFMASDTLATSISIFDILGRKIKSISVENINIGLNRIPIDLSKEQKGIYFCKILSKQDYNTLKILKN